MFILSLIHVSKINIDITNFNIFLFSSQGTLRSVFESCCFPPDLRDIITNIFNIFHSHVNFKEFVLQIRFT